MTIDSTGNEKLFLTASEIFFSALLVFFMGTIVFGQAEQTSQHKSPSKPDLSTEKVVLQPVFTAYRGLTIGAAADEVKEKLGKAKVEDKDGFYYFFSKDEQVQIRLDEDKKVSVIAITYSEKNEKKPKYEEVFGQAVPVVSRPDGSVYNLIRYPEAGIWVAYSATVGNEATLTVTIQKL